MRRDNDEDAQREGEQAERDRRAEAREQRREQERQEERRRKEERKEQSRSGSDEEEEEEQQKGKERRDKDAEGKDDEIREMVKELARMRVVMQETNERWEGALRVLKSTMNEVKELSDAMASMNEKMGRLEHDIGMMDDKVEGLIGKASSMASVPSSVGSMGVVVPKREKSIKPMTELNIIKYNKTIDYKEWIKDFEFEALLGAWSEQQKIANVMHYLSVDIRKVFKDSPDDASSYERIKETLATNYGNIRKKTRLQYEREFLELKMTEKTPVKNFMIEIKQKANLAEIVDETRICERFLEALRPVEVLTNTRRACQQKAKDLRRDLIIAEVLEVAVDEQKRYLEEKQLVEGDGNAKSAKCVSCDGDLKASDRKYCYPCREEHRKVEKKQDKATDGGSNMWLWRNDELRKAGRCFYCTKRMEDHQSKDFKECSAKYPNYSSAEVRKLLNEGKVVPPREKREGVDSKNGPRASATNTNGPT
jgi:hypothetical protein